jgi:hypothetical protein
MDCGAIGTQNDAQHPLKGMLPKLPVAETALTRRPGWQYSA